MINYFREAERVLEARAALEKALENLKRRQSRIIESHGPSGLTTTDLSRPYSSTAMVNDALNDCLELAEISREIQKTKKTIEEVDNTLAEMEQSEARLLRLWYIESKTKDEIAALLNYSSIKAIYAARNKAVGSFALIYYGAGVLASL